MPNGKKLTDCSEADSEDHHDCGCIHGPAFAPQDDGIVGTAHSATLLNLLSRGLVPMSSSKLVQVFEHENRQNLCNSNLTLSWLKVSS